MVIIIYYEVVKNVFQLKLIIDNNIAMEIAHYTGSLVIATKPEKPLSNEISPQLKSQKSIYDNFFWISNGKDSHIYASQYA